MYILFHFTISQCLIRTLIVQVGIVVVSMYIFKELINFKDKELNQLVLISSPDLHAMDIVSS